VYEEHAIAPYRGDIAAVQKTSTSLKEEAKTDQNLKKPTKGEPKIKKSRESRTSAPGAPLQKPAE